MSLQQFLLVREHVLALMTSKSFAGKLPVVPGDSLAVSDIARLYLLRTAAQRAPAGPGDRRGVKRTPRGSA